MFGCKPVPSIKLATNSLMYRHMAEDMDINCGVALEGTPLPMVGRQIFEEVIAIASGKRSKSELSGVGEEEFAPCIRWDASDRRAREPCGARVGRAAHQAVGEPARREAAGGSEHHRE